MTESGSSDPATRRVARRPQVVGIIDAVSYLGLGHAFAADMTYDLNLW